MNKEEKPAKLLWLDLEMTGLNPNTDRILEVAVIITDFRFKELGRYSSVIKHDSQLIGELLRANPFWANRSRGLKKITKECSNGRQERQVEEELIKLCEKFYSKNEPIYLAGNSIRVDRAFIDSWWPNLAGKLHYRMLDVSSFKIWWTGTGRDEFKKIEKHRALDDIRESIAELKYYTQQFDVQVL